MDGLNFGGGSFSPSGFAPGSSPGGGLGGGYFNSQESPANAKTRNVSHQSIYPCVIRQLHNAKQAHTDDVFKIDGQEINQVMVVGQVRQIQETTTHISFELQDCTAAINARVWVDDDQQQLTNENDRKWRQEGCYVRLIGNVRSFSDQRSLVGFKVRALGDMNELIYHYMDSLRVHLQNTRSPLSMQADPASQGIFLGGHQQAAATIPYENAYSATPSYSAQPQALGDQIKRIVAESNSVKGADIVEISNTLRSRGVNISDQEISNVIQILNDQGHLFHSVDDLHWKAC